MRGKENKTIKRDAEYLEKELSHVSWLLHQQCLDNEFLNNKLEKKSEKDDFSQYSEYLVENVRRYKSPRTYRVWDDYYYGWWLYCDWGNYAEWLWINNSEKKFYKNIAKDIHWMGVLNGIPKTQYYVWDDYYYGWWLFSKWTNDKVCWSWLG